MFLSKRSNGIYYLWFTDKSGKRKKVSTGSCLKSDALAFLRDFGGDRVGNSLAKAITLTQLIFEFQEYSKGVHTEKTRHSFASAFNEMSRFQGDPLLTQIGQREIEGFLSRKRVEASEWTARKYYIHLASAFEAAKRWGYLRDNPFRTVEQPRVRELQPVYFEMEEFRRLLAVIDDQRFTQLCLFGVYSGLRLGELLNLRWSEIDLNRKLIHVRNTKEFSTKSRRNRTIPINSQAGEFARDD